MSRINPSIRGFAIILLIAIVITVLQLQVTLISLLLLARIAFFLAITFFLFLLWRDRREEIAAWGRRSQTIFYGAVALALATIGIAVLTPYPEGGLELLALILTLVGCGYALWRVWRSEHTYGY